MIKDATFLLAILSLAVLGIMLLVPPPNGRADPIVVDSLYRPGQSFVMYPPPMSVLFDSGSATVQPSQWYPIDFTAWAMKSIYPNGEVLVIGYASAGGDKEKNDLLSRNRAEEVKRLLVKAGVSVDRISVDYRGAFEADLNGCSTDRRVEIVIQERLPDANP